MFKKTPNASNLLYTMLCLVFFSFCSCKKEPDFFINGKGYYTENRCVKDTSYYKWSYEYGYSYRGKMEFYWGNHRQYKCLESVVDTIEVK